MKSSRFTVGTLVILSLICTSTARAVDFEWVGLGGDNLWTNADNWDEIVFPDALDNIILTGASLAGPVTIDVDVDSGASFDFKFGLVTLAAGDALLIDIEGILPSEFDSLFIGGDAALAGALNVAVDPLFSLTAGQSFEIVDIDGTQSGMFAGLADGALVGNFGGVDLFIDYDGGDGNDVVLTAGVIPILPGDGNGDGWVDGLDYLLWAGNFGTHPGPDGDISDGDYNDDGWIDGLDYLLWAGNFGTHASTAVPEPGSAMILAIGVGALVTTARRRRSA